MTSDDEWDTDDHDRPASAAGPRAGRDNEQPLERILRDQRLPYYPPPTTKENQ